MDADTVPPVHLAKVLDGLATNPALPAHLVRRLFAWRRSGGKVARRPDLTDDMYAEMIATAESIERRYRRRDKFTFWWNEAAVLTFSSEVLRRFVTDPVPRLRSFAPRDPNLPAALAEKLASDPEERVRRAVAPHRNLPLPSLLRLLADPCERVAEAAGASPFLPAAHMEWLLTRAGL
ncbi:hypothetical protein F9278_00720 [Streptomyces phaeolivaceus]|uniref:Uncharacterized protein n=1 Tax=Streptomyces phaeolivaceus TaxID=2653200 RepID=A0A5P8JWT2_9ACTN|nr:hypothetical protein [Streptomyces phaeolivaceus]QFQ94962.1 hypothetical protein F9278_00720 [Streptomyces phaeolivaceus]